ncbi:MAG TPA: hypothetical protein VMF55_17135 [Solirubrobacterales bacterium]|nr:hypothetical protein [Solirubrobacterales bacterium]
MNDEWRLQIDVQDDARATKIGEHLAARELEHDLSDAFADRVIVSRDGTRLFVYAGSREQVEAAGKLIAEVAADEGWEVETRLRRWHPQAEDWENPDEPLPASAESAAEEHEALIASERNRSEFSGEPEWEVRIDCDSHHDAVAFAKKLEAEGIPAVRRWKYLVVGATDEDSARALAVQLAAEAPEGSEIKAEGSGRIAWAERPPNPFAIFGGLGG